jgi:nucleoside-diphosphate-sugar epimerase
MTQPRHVGANQGMPPNFVPMKRLIFGPGYLGERVANRWHTNGDDVTVVTRSKEHAAYFRRQGFTPIIADVTMPDTLTNLPVADTVLFAVGDDRVGGPAPFFVYASIRYVLDALPAGTGRFIYISTTGVYGPSDGDWVDEQSPTDPQRDGARASLASEQALSEHPLAANAVVLRLAGIYGPSRVPFLKELSSGSPIEVPSTGYLNLVHVDDAATVVLAASRTANNTATPRTGPQLYNVSDGVPVARHDFYREVTRLINAPPPQFVEADPDSPRALRARGNRRVRNDKMLAELGVSLTYPDYRAGLAAILETRNQQTT